MQEGVDLSVFGQEFSFGRVRRFKKALVFGVERDQIRGHGFERCQHFVALELGPRVDEETAGLIPGGGEHAESSLSVGLVAEIAEIADSTLAAVRTSRGALIAAVED